MRLFKKHKKYSAFDIDTVFLDNANMPVFDRSQKEGSLEQTITRRTVAIVMVVASFLIFIMGLKAIQLQLVKGSKFAARAENNRLNEIPLFARRGVIEDRNGELLAWNALEKEDINSGDTLEYIPDRLYTDRNGMGHVIGYVSYPKKDTNGNYWQSSFVGRDGVEKLYNTELAGQNGARLIEVDVTGQTLSTNLAENPTDGKRITLTIDSRMSDAMYRSMESLSNGMGYKGGGAVVMDIAHGDILTMTSYPEYDSSVLSRGDSKGTVANYFSDSRSIFLNRVFQGAYAPGSIVKPFIALEALRKGVITPEVSILSTGSMSVPNPYNPSNPTIFKDWRVNGYTDMRKAIAVSSDIYFYQVGGGFGSQKGIGINAIDEVAKAFGIGEKTNIIFPGEVTGVIPTPEWKLKVFDGDPWRVGDTYNSSIGQYGWQVTPIQMARATAGIASSGILPHPRLTFNEPIKTEKVKLDFTKEQYKVVREGMRMTVTDGTATILNIPQMSVAVKTGTAQTGIGNSRINSWVVGFFPYENPKYSFAVLMEGAPSTASQSASFVIRDFLQILGMEHPEVLEYLEKGE
jgi:penicillin-binding protein 2